MSHVFFPNVRSPKSDMQSVKKLEEFLNDYQDDLSINLFSNLLDIFEQIDDEVREKESEVEELEYEIEKLKEENE